MHIVHVTSMPSLVEESTFPQTTFDSNFFDFTEFPLKKK